jgi:hypothetical protein
MESRIGGSDAAVTLSNRREAVRKVWLQPVEARVHGNESNPSGSESGRLSYFGHETCAHGSCSPGRGGRGAFRADRAANPEANPDANPDANFDVN